MPALDFDSYFRQATGNGPYPFQERFATAAELPTLVRAPTGSGKTATVVLGWLWRRFQSSLPTPRRLVYCLPMRVLVEQSAREAKKWIDALKLNEQVGVHVLMGGVDWDEWYLHPERPAVLIGTQDMLLSRALNRGYAETRFHWPIDFGLLNNDCLWVFDEPQLMASGVSTSAQLAGLRRKYATFGTCPSVWMSATLEQNWLNTIDNRAHNTGQPLELGSEDYDPSRPLHKRMTAQKTLTQLDVDATKEAAVAKAILARHQNGTQTLVIANTVDRARKVYDALKKEIKKSPIASLLIHSRFRSPERRLLNEQLQVQGEAAQNRIIVATQVVEAGVDISARTLVTDLAPWPSIVQRLGRCNRTGNDGPGRAFWINLDSDKQGKPYETADLDQSRGYLQKLEGQDVSPKALEEFGRAEGIVLKFEHKHVLRSRDLLDLFDTSPDLSGNDIDVSRFVRGDDPDTDVQVLWREPNTNDWNAEPRRDELCNVPIGSAKSFLEKLGAGTKKLHGYVWDHLEDRWQAIDNPKREVRPGLTILLPHTAGGYSELGWDESSATIVAVVPGIIVPADGAGGDPISSAGGPALTITQHTANVCRELDLILKEIGAQLADWPERLKISARWHDAGKAHFAFQHGVRRVNPQLAEDQLWAKSGVNGRLRHARRQFRHELASALAARQHKQPFEVAYLIAAHHGKVRLSIRSLPGEDLPDDPNKLFAFGVHDGDKLPNVDLGGVSCPETTLDLSPMKLGGEHSWTALALELRDRIGPFQLAYLEALLRAADLRASQQERVGARP